MNDSTAPHPLGVSFVIVARNSARFIPNLLADVVGQELHNIQMEIIFVDGASTDGTKQVATSILAACRLPYQICDNPRKILSTGWNVALQASQYPIVIRVDAHARIPSDFVAKNVAAHSKGEFITGGPIRSDSEDHCQSILNAVELSRFGAGAADFRNPRATSFYADTVGFAAYRREVFAHVGGYHEHLVRHQDNEIHFRMRCAGYRFFFDPTINSTRFARRELRPYLRQKFVTGYWIPLAASVRPGCFAARHYVPMLFVSALFASAVLAALFDVWWVPLLVFVPYFATSFAYTILALLKDNTIFLRQSLLLPLMFFATHVAYGLGTIAGVARAPAFWARYRRYKLPRPVASADCSHGLNGERASDANIG